MSAWKRSKSVREMTVDELLEITRVCSVCFGSSPKWDGHDSNPPCQGKAREEIARRARLVPIEKEEEAET